MMSLAKAGMVTMLAVLSVGCSSFSARHGDSWDGYTESGKASFYADRHQNHKTASGERYRHDLKTAAHKELPFGSRIQVTNVDNGKSVVVKVNDRGPFVRGRIVDLSRSAFSAIANPRQGVIDVELEVIE